MEVANATVYAAYSNSTPTIRHQIQVFKPFEEYEAILFAVILIFLCIFGMLANGITILAIWRSPKLNNLEFLLLTEIHPVGLENPPLGDNTVFNIFLMSLCVSDFLSAIDSLGVLYRRTWGFREWRISTVLCKITLGLELWTTVATMQHVVVFSVLRLISLKMPVKFKRITPFHAKVTVCFLWFESFFVGFIPFFTFLGVKPAPKDLAKPYWYSCTMQKKWLPSVKLYTNVGFPFLLYIPLFLVVTMSFYIIFLILQRRQSSRFKTQVKTAASKKENFALLQLSVVAFSFLLGYIPDIGYRLYSFSARSHGIQLKNHINWVLSLISHTLLRFSECLNPILYNLASSNMREATYRLLTGRNTGRVQPSTAHN